MIQLILHLIGDYVLQSDWMAQNKRKSSIAAGAHAVTYSLPFLLLQPSWMAFAVILGTHFLIDRFGLARYVVWLKNVLFQPLALVTLFLPLSKERYDEIMERTKPEQTDYREMAEARRKYAWSNCNATGYPSDAPPWLAVWLLIACDNTLHLLINYLALKHL